mmetsp:Transcript_11009/g.12719  ORF Transcript_11009/g.12719 Transcript_11009/m.12719 type:complete len:637 (+) Transcript_11009:59-1969(+)
MIGTNFDTYSGTGNMENSTEISFANDVEKGVRPYSSYAIQCKNLNVSYGDKHILKDINVSFLPGTLTALMGPSGAGKTTLLTALSNKDNSGTITGEMTINNKVATSDTIRSLSTLTPQLDILIPVLTPRECFSYAAQLALKATKEEQVKRVNEVLEDLSLTHVADVIIGNEDIKGLSGGERKRCSVGLDLLTNPKIMYLDEPTSGLDSKVAFDVVRLLKDLAERKNKTIVCTIHQPSFQVFSEFDFLVLLNFGELVYSGEVSQVAPYYAGIGIPVPEFTNPADHMILALSSSQPKDGSTFVEAFRNSAFGRKDKEYQEDGSTKAGNFDSLDDVNLYSGTTWFHQLQVLFRRSSYVTIRDSKQLKVRLIQQVFISLLLGALYFDLAEIQTTQFDRQSVLFMVCLFALMSSIMGTIITMPIEKAFVKREYGNGNFTVSAFYLARVAALYVFQSIYMTVFSAITYPMIGLQEGVDHFLTFLGLFLLLGFIAVSLGFFFGTIFPDVTSATAVVPLLIIPLVFFSGLFITFENIPVYFVWMYYLSFVQYAYQILVVNEFRDKLFEPCSVAELTTPGSCPLGACNSDPFNITVPAEACPGTLVVENLDYDADAQYINWAVLGAYWILIVAIGAVAINRFLRR